MVRFQQQGGLNNVAIPAPNGTRELSWTAIVRP
jgi:hypothetical protein